MKLSEHFSEAEFGAEHADERIKSNFRWLCETLLDPIRSHLGAALRITSGWHSRAHNSAVGGVRNSQHLALGGAAAADFTVKGADLRLIFDWIRLESGLPFDQLILAHDSRGKPAEIHISGDRLKPPRRVAGTRGTGHDREYVAMEVRPAAADVQEEESA